MIKWLSTKFNLVLITLVAFLFASLLSIGYLYKEELKVSTKAQEEVTTLQNSIAEREKQIKDEQDRVLLLEVKRKVLNVELVESKRSLDKMKGRESTVKAKPKLVAMKIQKSFDSLMKEIYCVTGEESQCVK